MKRNGFRPLWRSAEHGFTLVEMLIALLIFGMLTAAGVTLLTLTVRTQETSERLLGQLGEVRALGALLTADLARRRRASVATRTGSGSQPFAAPPATRRS